MISGVICAAVRFFSASTNDGLTNLLSESRHEVAEFRFRIDLEGQFLAKNAVKPSLHLFPRDAPSALIVAHRGMPNALVCSLERGKCSGISGFERSEPPAGKCVSVSVSASDRVCACV